MGRCGNEIGQWGREGFGGGAGYGGDEWGRV